MNQCVMRERPVQQGPCCGPWWGRRVALSKPHWPPLLMPTTGSLNLLVRSRNKGALDTHAWSLSGNKGNVWQQAHVPINPSGPFQVSLPGPRPLTGTPSPWPGALGGNHFGRKARVVPGSPGSRCGKQQGVGMAAPRAMREGRQSVLQNLPNLCSLLSDPTPDYF